MPFAYQCATVLDMIQRFVAGQLNAIGEPSAGGVAYTFTLVGYSFDPQTLPDTIIEVSSITSQTDISSDLLEMSLNIHHIRTRGSAPQMSQGAQNPGIEEFVAIDRLGKIASALKNDYRLASVGGAAIPVHEVTMSGILIGADNPLQSSLNAGGQAQSLCAASLGLSVAWYEGQY